VIHHLLQVLFKISLVIFMVGNLSAMGLQIQLADAIIPLKNRRFALRTLIACFVLGPALAYFTILVVPMEHPYAIGVLLLGMTPAAPFMPLVVKKANGNLAVAACFMLLASLGTIVIMPFGVPLISKGLSASAWSIAKPLILLVLLPLAIGIVIRSRSAAAANWLFRCVNIITGIGTLFFLLLVILLDFKSFIGAIGSHAFLAQILYVPALAVVGYLMGSGLPDDTRSVMSLGMCTRNIGVAAAIVGTDGDERTMVMLVIATLVTLTFSFVAAARFARMSHNALQIKPLEKTAKT
jgi:bile acid:Na+ symporter, BASS family